MTDKQIRTIIDSHLQEGQYEGTREVVRYMMDFGEISIQYDLSQN